RQQIIAPTCRGPNGGQLLVRGSPGLGTLLQGRGYTIVPLNAAALAG
ncbi:MAG: hypothetical protein GX970_11730, partial [Phyllobacteriaceae bacterium]|nr:hypothetical protein [Phyllobacteriaceae bacterium]